MLAEARRKEWVFFVEFSLEATYQNLLNTNHFLEGIIQKNRKNGTLTAKFGEGVGIRAP